MWNSPFAGNFPNGVNQEELLFPFGHVPTTPQPQQGFPGMPQNFLSQNNTAFFENGNGEDHSISSNLDLSLFNRAAFHPNQVMSPIPQVSVAQHDLS
jgi:hypothetical protein